MNRLLSALDVAGSSNTLILDGAADRRPAGAPDVLPCVHAIMRCIHQHQRFAVTSHKRPDGDAVGSALAFAHMLHGMGKQCDVFFADPIPLVYLTLPGVDQIQPGTSFDPAQYQVAVALECDGIDRTGILAFESLPLINIDHHMTGCDYGTLNWVDHSVAAVGILVLQLAQALQVDITPAMATCLYTAVFTDTGAFTYPGTAGSALPFAQELIQYGADADRIARDILYSVSAAHIRLLGTALSRLHIEEATAWSYITQADLLAFGASDDDSEGTVNYLISIAGVDSALFLRELPYEPSKPQRFRVSLRSKSQLDVSIIATAHGGGGHQRAAGCSIAGPMEDVVAAMLAGIAESRLTGADA